MNSLQLLAIIFAVLTIVFSMPKKGKKWKNYWILSPFLIGYAYFDSIKENLPFNNLETLGKAMESNDPLTTGLITILVIIVIVYVFIRKTKRNRRRI